MGFASCPKDVTSTPNVPPYSQANSNNVNMAFQAIDGTVNANFKGQSPNYVNTYSDFIEQVQNAYNLVQTNDISSPTYTTGPADNRASTFGMMLASSMVLQETPR